MVKNFGQFFSRFSQFLHIKVEWRRDNGVNVFIESNYGVNNILTGAVNVILSLAFSLHLTEK
jgi:hypothetical protein